MIHNSEEKYLGWIKDKCVEVETPQPGDIAVFRYGRVYSHGGVVTCADPVTLVHAYADAGYVVEETFAQNGALTLPQRKPRFFSLWAGKTA